MTPLIQQLSKIASADGKYDFFDYNWFDATNAVGYHYQNKTQLNGQELISSPLPFSKMFVCSQIGRASIMLRIEEEETSLNQYTTVIGVMGFVGIKPINVGTIGIKKENGYFKTFEIGNKIPDAELKNIISVLAAFHSCLDETTTFHQPVVRNTYTNQRLIKKGKKPSFEWRTVTIEPKIKQSISLGGTHASPRLHDRRGHWRTMKKSGKRFWVRDCKVGDPSKGVIKHDYKFKSVFQGEQL